MSEAPGQLRRGVLGLGDAFAQSFALLSLALASSLATSVVAANTGAAAPWAYIVAGAGSVCLASVIIRFTRRMASAGGVYTYAARGLGSGGGFVAGWLYAPAFGVGTSFVMVISGFLLNQVLDAHAGIHLGSDGWLWCFLCLLVAGNPTVPWAEDTGSGKHSIFVSRLVGDHFELFNGGAPVSPAHRDAESPDITFFGNVPYVSWIEPHGDENRGFIGHFLPTGQFVSDTPFGILLAPHIKRAPLIDARVALSSSCTSDPFTNDGEACPVAQVNAPFATFTTAGQPQRLFSQAIIGGPNGPLFPGCKLAVVPTDDGADTESTLGSGQTVGILVQRIVAIKHVHGAKVPVLRPVGRVPLGHHHSGHVKIHWDLKVNGHRLGKGTYQILLRSLEQHRNVLGTTNPVTLTIRH